MEKQEGATNKEKEPIEIERKFLIKDIPENLDTYNHEEVSQGYLVIGVDGSEARIRKRDEQYTITVKSKGNLSRGEWESDITKDQFDKLWPATDGSRVEKTRYSIPYNESLIELDIYKDEFAGLVSAEVEFPDKPAAEKFSPPEWFSTEVTDDRSFKNQQLAINGLPKQLD